MTKENKKKNREQTAKYGFLGHSQKQPIHKEGEQGTHNPKRKRNQIKSRNQQKGTKTAGKKTSASF